MNTQQPNDENSDRSDADTEQEVDALRTQLSVLREENDRLREEYTRAKQTTHRRTAISLAAVGISSLILGGVLSGVRDILFVLGAIGVFGGVLTWYLSPQRVLTETVTESIYSALATNGERLRDELALQATPVYIPTQQGVRLFLPQHRDFTLPETVSESFLTEDPSRGLALTPSGEKLAREFKRAKPRTQAESLQETANQVSDALVEQFEIADTVSITESEPDGRFVISIEGTAFGPINRFDHPAVSLIACTLTLAHDGPITVEPIDQTTVAFDTTVPPLTA